jgi:hypothetical protein
MFMQYACRLLPGGAMREHIPLIDTPLLLSLQVAHTLFGYTKTELRGKNVNLLLPPVIAEQHTSYIRNYISTGVCRECSVVCKLLSFPRTCMA